MYACIHVAMVCDTMLCHHVATYFVICGQVSETLTVVKAQRLLYGMQEVSIKHRM